MILREALVFLPSPVLVAVTRKYRSLTVEYVSHYDLVVSCFFWGTIGTIVPHVFFWGTIGTIVPFHRTTKFRPSYQKVKTHRTSFCLQVFVVISVFDDLCVVGKLRISAFQRSKDHRKRKSPRKDMNHSCQSPSSHSSRYIIILYNIYVDILHNILLSCNYHIHADTKIPSYHSSYQRKFSIVPKSENPSYHGENEKQNDEGP